MVAGRQARRHEAVDDDQVRIQVSDDVDDGSKDVHHLTASVGHDLGCIGTNGTSGLGKSRRSVEGLRDAATLWSASRVFLQGLVHGDAVDLMIGDAYREDFIVNAKEGGEMKIQARISLEESLSRGEEDIELATLDVSDEQDASADEGSHC